MPCSKIILLFFGSSGQGDIYHPDFYLGHPSYFHLSIRSTIQSASSQAGVASVAGEVHKDTTSKQHQDMVSDN